MVQDILRSLGAELDRQIDAERRARVDRGGPGLRDRPRWSPVIAVLLAAGVTLLLERSLVRMLVGVILLGNGVNLLILIGGGPRGSRRSSAPTRTGDGRPAAAGDGAHRHRDHPGLTAFLLAVVHRSWQLTGGDEVQDDTEDRRVRLRARRGKLAEAVLARQEAYRRLVREQRAELARLAAARPSGSAGRPRNWSGGSWTSTWTWAAGSRSTRTTACPREQLGSASPRHSAPRRHPRRAGRSGSRAARGVRPQGAGAGRAGAGDPQAVPDPPARGAQADAGRDPGRPGAAGQGAGSGA